VVTNNGHRKVSKKKLGVGHCLEDRRKKWKKKNVNMVWGGKPPSFSMNLKKRRGVKIYTA